MAFAAAQYSAYAAAVLSFVNAVFVAALIAKTRNEWKDHDECDMDKFKALDPTCLRLAWDIDNKVRWTNFAANIVGGLLPSLIVVTAMALATIYRETTRLSTPRIMLVCFAAAAAIQTLQFTAEAGLHTTADWIDREFKLTNEALVPLTFSFILARSLFLWLFALDQLFIGVALMTAARLTYACREMPNGHGHLGVIGGFLGILNFGFEIARFGNWRLFSIVGMLSAFALMFLILPAWLIWTACLMPRFKHIGNREALMGGAPANTDASPNDFGLEMGPAGDSVRV